MNAIQAQKIAEKIAGSLSKPHPADTAGHNLKETWRAMSEADKARQILDWIIVLIPESL